MNAFEYILYLRLLLSFLPTIFLFTCVFLPVLPFYFECALLSHASPEVILTLKIAFLFPLTYNRI